MSAVFEYPDDDTNKTLWDASACELSISFIQTYNNLSTHLASQVKELYNVISTAAKNEELTQSVYDNGKHFDSDDENSDDESYSPTDEKEEDNQDIEIEIQPGIEETDTPVSPLEETEATNIASPATSPPSQTTTLPLLPTTSISSPPVFNDNSSPAPLDISPPPPPLCPPPPPPEEDNECLVGTFVPLPPPSPDVKLLSGEAPVVEKADLDDNDSDRNPTHKPTQPN